MRSTIAAFVLIAAALLAWAAVHPVAGAAEPKKPEANATAVAVFAGGCFWCMEEAFEKLPGVGEVLSGYTGGQTWSNPATSRCRRARPATPKRSRSTTIRRKITYSQLLYHFWRNVDPLTANAQFCDSGTQYRSAIFVRTDEERRLAEESKKAVATRFGKPVVDRDRGGGEVLSRRGVPPGLLHEEPGAIPFLQERLRAGEPSREAVG